MDEIINEFIKMRKKVIIYPIFEKWQDFGSVSSDKKKLTL
jgi:hypothetical protein